MASPMAGCWQLYGKENTEVLSESLMLPAQFKCAMSNVRICEEVHVNGENVHVNIHVPSYSIPAHGKDINFTFGVEHEQSLPFGKHGKGTVTKESDCKWVAKMMHDNMTCTITREIRNGEMWVTIEGKDVKTVRKFERCTEGCTGAPACPNASPFQGKWKLYGSDNFEKFMEALGVPPHWRCIFANMCVCESIHVNGNDVHIKICMPEVTVPMHSHECSGKFGVPHEMCLPFGHRATATTKKVSDTKWEVALTNCPKMGDAMFTREMVGEEMWCTLDVKGKRVVYKFVRKGSCGDATAMMCPTMKKC